MVYRFRFLTRNLRKSTKQVGTFLRNKNSNTDEKIKYSMGNKIQLKKYRVVLPMSKVLY